MPQNKKYTTQEQEVLDKLNEYDKAAGIDQVVTDTEKLKVHGFVVPLVLDGKDPEKSFKLFNMYRKSKRGIHSIAFKRGQDHVFIEYHLRDHPNLDFSKKTHVLLYADANRSFDIWKSLQLNEQSRYLKIDVRSDFPVVSKEIPED